MAKPRRGRPLHEVAHNPATAWVILLVSFVLTALAWHISDNAVRKRAAERFGFQSKDVVGAISKRMQEYEMVLRAGVGLFNASSAVTREEWRSFTEDLQLQRHFPGIQGVGFSLMVAPEDKARHVAAMRAQGFPQYTLRPEGQRLVYSSIIYLEPFDWRNQRAFGYDMYSEPTRRAAMERARDTGAAAVSGRVTLLQETRKDVQHGFLMYLPVYRRGMPVATVEERRAALLGFVYSPFRARDLMQGILGAGQDRLDFELYDGGAPSPESLLYNHAEDRTPRYRPLAPDAWLEALHPLSIAGRTWSLYVYARPGYLSAVEENQPLLVAVGGIGADILLFLVIMSLSRQRKLAERMAGQITDELAHSEKRYRALFEGAKAPMLIIDPQDGAIVGANDAAAAFYGYEGEQMGHMRVMDINMLPPAEIYREMEQARLQQKDCFHFSHRLANGEVRRVEVRSGPIELGGRELLLSVIVDITQRWRLEEAKQRQLASLRALNEIQSIGEMPLADQLRQALAIGCRLTGLEFGIVSRVQGERYQVVSHVAPAGTLKDGQVFPLGKTYCSITLARTGVLAIDHMADSVYAGHPCYEAFKLEAYVGAKLGVDGASYGTVNFSSAKPSRAFEDSDLEFVALLAKWVGSAIERDQARQRLAESELRLKTIVDTEPECVQVLDAQGRIVQINPAGMDFYQADSQDQVLDRPVTDFLAPEYRNACLALQKRVLEGDSGRAEVEVLGLAGRRRWLEAHAVPLRNSQGEVTGVLSVARDTTERRQAEAELREAKEAAEAANLAKSQFLATMSHEIRTPMNGILGMTQLLLLPDLEMEQVQDYAQTIHASGQTLMALLNDILDLSKVEAGKLELLESPFDPEEVLEEIAALFAGPAHNKGLEIGVEWRGPRPGRYRADPIRLRQMLSNLVSNAIKFTSEGTIRVEATEAARGPEGAKLVFTVTDEGVGIPQDKQALLFEAFSQVDMSYTRHHGGTGLGLSIVRSLARLMGGDVGVESQLGQGSRFWFTIQAHVDDAQSGGRDTESRVSDAASGASLAGRRVLVVEDNLVNRRVVVAMLERLGLDVEAAENGREAVDLVTRGPAPELVLMDCQMPVMDGYEATLHLREWEAEAGRPRLPILALTANAFEEDRQRCHDVGMDDFITKPVHMGGLREVLERWLGHGT